MPGGPHPESTGSRRTEASEYCAHCGPRPHGVCRCPRP